MTNKGTEITLPPGNGTAREAWIQTQAMNWLRFWLAVAVVFIHIKRVPGGNEVYAIIRLFFSNVMTHIAAPTFFLIAGYFFFRGCEKWDWRVYAQKLKRRFFSMLLPYVIWNLLVLAQEWGDGFSVARPLEGLWQAMEANGGWRMFWNSEMWANRQTNLLGVLVPLTGPVNFPLWFLRDLMVLAVVSPAVFWFLKRTGWMGVAVLGGLYVSGLCPPIPGICATGVFFFSAGAWVGMRGRSLVAEFRRVRWISYVGALALLIMAMWRTEELKEPDFLVFPFSCYIVFGVCAAVNLSAHLVEHGVVMRHPVWARASFFVYASHLLIVRRYSPTWAGWLIGGDSSWALTGRYFATVALTVAVCTGTYALMRRCCPRVLGILAGNR